MRQLLLPGAGLLLLAVTAAAQGEGPPPGALYKNPHPEIERLLHAGARLPYPPSPERLAALPETSELLTRMVVDEAVCRLVISSTMLVRAPGAALYSIVLGIQVARYPDGGLLSAIRRSTRVRDVRSGLACLLELDANPYMQQEGLQWRQGLRRRAPALYSRALAYHRLRMALDQPLLAQLLERLPAYPTRGQVERLHPLLSRVTRGALVWLAGQRGRLAPAHRVLLAPLLERAREAATSSPVVPAAASTASRKPSGKPVSLPRREPDPADGWLLWGLVVAGAMVTGVWWVQR